MIDQIALTNFKAFRALDLPLAPLTLLTGINAVGKSSTMQALALIKQSVDSDTLAHGNGLLLNGELVDLGYGQDVLHEDYGSGGGATPSIGIRLTTASGDYSWHARYDAHQDREADILQLESGPTVSDSRVIFGPNFQYLRADRVAPEVYYPKSHTAVVMRKFLGAQGEHTANFLRVRGTDPVPAGLRHPSIRTSLLADNVEGWLTEICPGVNVDSDDLKGTNLVRLSYGFFGRAGISSSSIRYRPTNVGFGLTYALPIIVACLSVTRGSTVMLENPEAHLHPMGQAAMGRLAALAAAQGVQVIVESHSDHVLNGIRLAVKDNIIAHGDVVMHYFHRSEPKKLELPFVQVRQLTVGPNGMLSSWPPGFFDEWDKAVDRLLD